jgi:glycosyltransferase involved in cell wall biosynthesis
MSQYSHAGTAVLIPCHNEAACIAKVIRDFRDALPGAEIHVCDNASTDATAEVAATAGAIVCYEDQPGKGNAVRRLFSDVEADIYLLVDGDDTYASETAPAMVARLDDGGLDMVVGTRRMTEESAYRTGHRFGNRVLSTLVAVIFGNRVTDLLSGYRVFSRRFVKSFPALSTGFETETELTVHALELRMPVAEIETAYRPRPADSSSKLNTWRDGFRILRTIGQLIREERPFAFFSSVAVVLATTAFVLSWPLLITYLEQGTVPRFPTAILATGIMLLAFLSFTCGIVLDTVTRGRREIKRLSYLAVPRRTSARQKAVKAS